MDKLITDVDFFIKFLMIIILYFIGRDIGKSIWNRYHNENEFKLHGITKLNFISKN